MLQLLKMLIWRIMFSGKLTVIRDVLRLAMVEISSIHSYLVPHSSLANGRITLTYPLELRPGGFDGWGVIRGEMYYFGTKVYNCWCDVFSSLVFCLDNQRCLHFQVVQP